MNTTSVTADTGGHGPVVNASLMETPPGRPAPREARNLVRVPPKITRWNKSPPRLTGRTEKKGEYLLRSVQTQRQEDVPEVS